MDTLPGYTRHSFLYIASKTFSTVVREAVRDQDIKAIVLRVNSPGGRCGQESHIGEELLYPPDIPVSADVSSLLSFVAVLSAPTPYGGRPSGLRRLVCL